MAKLTESSAAVVRVQAEAPNQIELRKTSAEGIGEVVSFLAGLHALYDESNPRKALKFFAQAPRTAEALRHRAQAYLEIGDRGTAMKTLEEALALDPGHVQSRAQLADLYWVAGRLTEAEAEYQRVAASGQSYTSSHGIAYRGMIYVREMFVPPGDDPNVPKDSATLLAVSPQTQIVTRRWCIPGIIRSFESASEGFLIRYAADPHQKQIETLAFRGNDFDFLPPPGGNMLLRMLGTKTGCVLPQNFTGDLVGIMEKRPAHPRLRLTTHTLPGLPQTLPDLEKALRAAADHDPTQPWHLFWLGQTLWAEGKPKDAERFWGNIVTRDYPGILYTSYAWMATYCERLSQRDWADRMFAKALRERQRMPQPIQFSTLIERLINVQFTRMHPRRPKDPERDYVLLQRARIISGVTEADNYSAAAWAGYFRRKGDLARARVEERNARAFALNPFNITSPYTLLDYALYALFATWFGFVGTAILLFRKADRSTSGPKQYLQAAVHSWNTGVPPQWLPFAVGATIASILILGAGIALGITWSRGAAIALVAFALIFFAHTVGVLERATQIYRELPNRDRLVLLATYLLFLGATARMNSAMHHADAISSVPIGISDSLGHPVLVSDLESRLAKSANPELRYLTAVANQLGGKTERARELYRQLPDDRRARQALAALEAGRPEIIMPDADEVLRAYSTEPVSFITGLGRFDNPKTFVKLGVVAWFVMGTMFLVPCAWIRPASRRPPLAGPRTRTGRLLAKIGFLLVPGSFDLLRRSAVRGAATMTLTGFALLFAISFDKAFPITGSPGIFTAMDLPNVVSSSPLPPDTSRVDLMFAPPYARWFWSFAIIAVLSLLVLHATRIPAILSLYPDEPVQAEATLLPGTAQEPA